MVSVNSKSAFDLIYRWVEAVVLVNNEDCQVFCVSLSDFLVELGHMISNWCADLSRRGYRSLSAMEIYKKKLERWKIKGHIGEYSIETFVQSVLQQLSNSF